MEVFLVKMIDYQGDVKAEACRLEHAITDELEMALDRLLGYPEKTPFGDPIPGIERQIEPIASSMLLPLNSLPDGNSGQIELLVLEGTEVETLKRFGLEVGSFITVNDGKYSIDGKVIEISSDLAALVLIRTQ